jgi:hypothetical protein
MSVSGASKTKLAGQNFNQTASFLPWRTRPRAPPSRGGSGQSPGPAGLHGRSEGRRSRLASCPNVVNRCYARRAPRACAAPLGVRPFRRPRGCPPDWSRVKTVWRRAMRSPDVQARLLCMSGDARVEWQLVRDAQRYQESVLDPLSAPVPRVAANGSGGRPGVENTQVFDGSLSRHTIRKLSLRPDCALEHILDTRNLAPPAFDRPTSSTLYTAASICICSRLLCYLLSASSYILYGLCICIWLWCAIAMWAMGAMATAMCNCHGIGWPCVRRAAALLAAVLSLRLVLFQHRTLYRSNQGSSCLSERPLTTLRRSLH